MLHISFRRNKLSIPLLWALLCLSVSGFQIVGDEVSGPRHLFISEISTERGEFLFPVHLSEGEGVVGIQFGLGYDSDVLELLEVLPGSLLLDHELVLNTVFPGDIETLVVSRSLSAMNSGPGSVIEIRFRNIADEDAEFELFENVASRADGSLVEIESVVIPDIEIVPAPLLDSVGLILWLVSLLSSAIFLIRWRGLC